MTEGKQMLGTVYVYKNSQFMNNTDIQYLQKEGRANAHPAGFTTCKVCRVQQFAGAKKTPAEHGKTVAHEFGHYILGLYDEYREAKSTSTRPSYPQSGDTPRDSMMQNQLLFSRLSTADDYADPANRKTAQFRVAGKSAWEALSSDPATDLTPSYRIQYQPFKGMTPPTKVTLTQPTTGWEKDLKVVYMGASDTVVAPRSTTTPTASAASAASVRGPINVIVIDTSVTAEVLTAQRNAVAQMVDASGDGNRIAVYAHPFTSTPIVPLTVLSSAEKRASVKQAIAKIALDTTTDEKTIGDRIFDWAETQLPTFFPAGVTTQQNIPGWNYRLYPTGKAVGVSGGHLFYYDGQTLTPLGAAAGWMAQTRGNLSTSLQKALESVQAVRTVADTPVVSLFTSSTQTVDSGLVASFRSASIAVNPVVLNTAGAAAGPRLRSTAVGKTSMFDLAKGTLGNFKEATKPADLPKVASKSANAAEGDDVQPVNEGGVGTMTSIVTAGIDQQAIFSAYTEAGEMDKVRFTLTAPNGVVITPTNLPAGIGYGVDGEEGSFTYTVEASYAGFSGVWKSTATTAVTDGIVVQVMDVTSPLGAGWDMVDDALIVEISGPVAVTGATVVADIASLETGEIVRSGLLLLDDGTGADGYAGDGTYAVSLADLPAGEYEMQIKISNNGSAVYTTAGNTEQGEDTPPESVGAFQRVIYDVFVK